MDGQMTFIEPQNLSGSSLQHIIKGICSKNHINCSFVPGNDYLKNPEKYTLYDPTVVFTTDIHFINQLCTLRPELRIITTEQPHEAIQLLSSLSYSITDYANHLCRHLAETGRDRAALFSFCSSSLYVDEHIKAYMHAAEQYGIHLTKDDIYWRDRCSFMDCWNKLRVNLQHYNAVICANDISAVYLCKSAAAAGYFVPRDFSVSGRADTLIGKLTRPTITTSVIDTREFSKQLINLWRYLVRNPGVKKITALMEQPLYIGESTQAHMPVKEDVYTPIYREQNKDAEVKGNINFSRMEEFLLACDPTAFAIIYEIIDGKTNREIAEDVFIEERTLANKIKKMKEQLHVRTKKELIDAFLEFNIK